jgi:hypothetical protein
MATNVTVGPSCFAIGYNSSYNSASQEEPTICIGRLVDTPYSLQERKDRDEAKEWRKKNCHAYNELMKELDGDEQIESIMFGGYNGYESSDSRRDIVPDDKKRKALTLEEAKPYMFNWSFNHGYGRPKCFSMYAYTNRHIYFIETYDGSTQLTRIPLKPEFLGNDIVGMVGGG